MRTDPFVCALSYHIDTCQDLNQAELSARLNISPAYLTQLKKGQRNGRESLRREIADAFGYSYDEFLRMGTALAQMTDAEYEIIIKEDGKRGGEMTITSEEYISHLKQTIEDLKKERDKTTESMQKHIDKWEKLANDLINKGIRPPVIDNRDQGPEADKSVAQNF